MIQTEKRFFFRTVPIIGVHNFKTAIATGLKPGVNIHQSLYYTHYEFSAVLTSSMGVAIKSVACT